MYTFSNVHEKGFAKRHEAVVCLCVGWGWKRKVIFQLLGPLRKR